MTEYENETLEERRARVIARDRFATVVAETTGMDIPGLGRVSKEEVDRAHERMHDFRYDTSTHEQYVLCVAKEVGWERGMESAKQYTLALTADELLNKNVASNIYAKLQALIEQARADHAPKRTPVPDEVHESGWQWRPVTEDTAFAPPFGTIRACSTCGVLIAGGPSICSACA